jgi:hypothetical protein
MTSEMSWPRGGAGLSTSGSGPQMSQLWEHKSTSPPAHYCTYDKSYPATKIYCVCFHITNLKNQLIEITYELQACLKQFIAILWIHCLVLRKTWLICVFNSLQFKGIVSRDLVVCFLVSFDRYDISTHQEWVLSLLKVRFRIEFFDFRVGP